MGIGSLVNGVLSPLGVRLSKVEMDDTRKLARPNFDLQDQTGPDVKIKRVLNIVNYTKASGTTYSADAHESAYHTLTLDDYQFAGQRNPGERLQGVPFDFSGATILDIGCNQGGMIFELSDKIGHGIGIDYDYRMINAANKIKSYRQTANVDFYVFDLENENLDFINSYLTTDRVDVVFLLSVCMWIKNWHQVVDKAHAIGDYLLFESNGTPQQQADQEAYLRSTYSGVEKIRDNSPDDPGQKNRKLFFCTG